MSLSIKGKLKAVMNEEQVTDKFKKREFVVTVYHTDKYPQDVKFQLSQDRTDLIDAHFVGDVIDVHFNLRGKEFTNQEGKVNYFMNLEAWKILAVK